MFRDAVTLGSLVGKLEWSNQAVATLVRITLLIVAVAQRALAAAHATSRPSLKPC
jgi:hypothetical protein